MSSRFGKAFRAGAANAFARTRDQGDAAIQGKG
jgi:hypothetical protein